MKTKEFPQNGIFKDGVWLLKILTVSTNAATAPNEIKNPDWPYGTPDEGYLIQGKTQTKIQLAVI